MSKFINSNLTIDHPEVSNVYNKIKNHMLISKRRSANSRVTFRTSAKDPDGTVLTGLNGYYKLQWCPKKNKEDYTVMTFVQFCDAYGIGIN